MTAVDQEERVMIGYSTNLDWRGGPDHGWRVELLKDGQIVAALNARGDRQRRAAESGNRRR